MILIGLDDTDNLHSRGTGRLARRIADALSAEYPVIGVTRHQLYKHPSVPCTKKNSAACISLKGPPSDIPDLAEVITSMMVEDFQQGSDPGLCIAAGISEPVIGYGHMVKTSLVRQHQARTLAQEHQLFLRGLGGNEGGVIGALAAVGLAADGSDGRYIRVGRVRELEGLLPISEILQAGVDSVQTLQGEVIEEGWVQAEKLRPARRKDRPVLFVERQADRWLALKVD